MTIASATPASGTVRRYHGIERLVRVDEVLARRLGVDEPLELGDRLGLGHQRDDDAEHEVDDEGGRGGEEGRALARQVDHPGGGEPVDRDGRQGAGHEARPMPAVGVIRFQNMPRMKVAKSGALKNPNSVWR